mgnify:CR=1 FL=1
MHSKLISIYDHIVEDIVIVVADVDDDVEGRLDTVVSAPDSQSVRREFEPRQRIRLFPLVRHSLLSIGLFRPYGLTFN